MLTARFSTKQGESPDLDALKTKFANDGYIHTLPKHYPTVPGPVVTLHCGLTTANDNEGDCEYFGQYHGSEKESILTILPVNASIIYANWEVTGEPLLLAHHSDMAKLNRKRFKYVAQL